MLIVVVNALQDTWINANFIERIVLQPYYSASWDKPPSAYQVLARVSGEDVVLGTFKSKVDAQAYVMSLAQCLTQSNAERLFMGDA